MEQHFRRLVGLLEGSGQHALLGQRDGPDVGRTDEAVHQLPLYWAQPGRACLWLLCQQNAKGETSESEADQWARSSRDPLDNRKSRTDDGGADGSAAAP